jgi:RimJ/RimL family protein N-acetyltransferase
MQLRPATPADEWLTVALETDPRVMAELGGPWSAEDARAAHRRRVAAIADENWWFVVVPEPDQPPIGTIGVWPSEWAGEPASETGWMILPEHQGKGHATAALAALLELARHDPRWGDIHAFPGATNPASNALCRKFGFEQLDEVTVDYGGRQLRCNRWVWRAGTPAPATTAPSSGSASAR